MLHKTNIDSLLTKISPNYWNLFSHFIALFSLPTIGSPIKFNGPFGMSLVEYKNPSDMPEHIKNQYFNFKYKNQQHNCLKEVEIDKLYESYSSIFIVFNKENEIIGSEMYVIGDKEQKLPVEYSTYNNIKNEHFNIEEEVGNAKCVEIYKLIRSFNIKRQMVPALISMLFKAVWAKSIQVKADYIYLTCAAKKGLDALYNKRLAFDGPAIEITYDGKTNFKALRKGCKFHEVKVAALSKDHFWLQTYFRTGLKKKSPSEQNIPLMLFVILLQLIKIPFLPFKQWFFHNKKGFGEYWGPVLNTLRLFILSFFLSLFR